MFGLVFMEHKDLAWHGTRLPAAPAVALGNCYFSE